MLWNQILSKSMGWASIGCWIIVGFPEFYEMFKHKTGAGMSLTFLALWGIGDIFNLVGCILTNQLMTEIAVAIWYSIMDAILICQVLWYEKIFPGGYGALTIDDILETYDEESSPLIHGGRMNDGVSSPIGLSSPASNDSLFDTVVSSLANSNPRGFQHDWDSSSPRRSSYHPRRRSHSIDHEIGYNRASSPRNFTKPRASGNANSSSLFAVLALVGFGTYVSTSMYSSAAFENNFNSGLGNRVLLSLVGGEESDIESELCSGTPQMCFIGSILGWVSAVLYVLSRIPQLLKNFLRKSTEGVSIWMFFFSVLGNVTFSLSIFLWSTDKRFLLEKLPWIVGSLGTLAFDFAIFLQFFVYKNKAEMDYGEI